MGNELREFGSFYAERSRNGVAPPKKLRGSGYPMIGMGHLYSWPHIDVDGAERVPLPVREARLAQLQEGDLLFARRSLKWSGAGVCVMVPRLPELTVFESSIIRVRLDPTRASPIFVSYFFRAGPGRRAVESIIEQTAVAGIRATDLARLRIGVPPLREQRAIASVIGALDDKILSNRTLTQALHDLLPVLFARCVSTTEERMALGELGSIVGGGTPKSAEPSYWEPPEVAWITPKDMTALGGKAVIEKGARDISSEGLNGSSAKLLPPGSVVYTSRATLGLIAITQKPLATNQGFISVIPDQRFGSAFVYCALAALRERINDRANGSTFMEVNKTNFKAVGCPSPAADRLSEFRRSAEPLIVQISAVDRESRTLTAIRDALLPKLVSGQIRVPLSEDPEEQIGAATASLTAKGETASPIH